MIGLPVMPHQDKAAHPEPSVLTAAVVNSFLKRSMDPNSFLRTSAKAPSGSFFALEAGARFAQNKLCSTWPPAWKESSFRVAFISMSDPDSRALSSLSSIALAPFT